MKVTGGCLMPVVGPSGAGKDSLIRAAQTHFKSDPRVKFPRRVVTRKANAEAEDHDSMTDEEFALAVSRGDFALWWGAHGNHYGIPSSIKNDIASNCTVVFNCSREALSEVLLCYQNVRVIEVTAPEDVLIDRIVARGRETREQALKRVSRKPNLYHRSMNVTRIENGGSLATASAAFISAIAQSQKLAPNPG
jgi:ribose 1,5-bisphosphokinase